MSSWPVAGPYIIPDHKTYPDGYDDTPVRIANLQSHYKLSKAVATKLVQDHDNAQKTRKAANVDAGVVLAPVNSLQGGYKLSTFGNPPFDKRILNIGFPGTKLARGKIIQDKNTWKGTDQTAGYFCNFLYNPDSIGVNYNVDNTVLPQSIRADPNASAILSEGQVISFGLLFDRSYELATLDHQVLHKADYRAGVYADIAALERVCGINRGQGPMLPLPTNVYFGSSKVGIGSFVPLAFYGYISAMSVTYTHFSLSMTPIRAQVTLSFNQLIKLSDGTIQVSLGDTNNVSPPAA